MDTYYNKHRIKANIIVKDNVYYIMAYAFCFNRNIKNWHSQLLRESNFFPSTNYNNE